MNKKGEVSAWVFDVITLGIAGVIIWKIYQAATSKNFDIKKLFKKREVKEESKSEKEATPEELKKKLQELRIKKELEKTKKEIEKLENESLYIDKNEQELEGKK